MGFNCTNCFLYTKPLSVDINVLGDKLKTWTTLYAASGAGKYGQWRLVGLLIFQKSDNEVKYQENRQYTLNDAKI